MSKHHYDIGKLVEKVDLTEQASKANTIFTIQLAQHQADHLKATANLCKIVEECGKAVKASNKKIFVIGIGLAYISYKLHKQAVIIEGLTREVKILKREKSNTEEDTKF